MLNYQPEVRSNQILNPHPDVRSSQPSISKLPHLQLKNYSSVSELDPIIL